MTGFLHRHRNTEGTKFHGGILDGFGAFFVTYCLQLSHHHLRNILNGDDVFFVESFFAKRAGGN